MGIQESHKRLHEVKFELKKSQRPDYYAMLEVEAHTLPDLTGSVAFGV